MGAVWTKHPKEAMKQNPHVGLLLIRCARHALAGLKISAAVVGLPCSCQKMCCPCFPFFGDRNVLGVFKGFNANIGRSERAGVTFIESNVGRWLFFGFVFSFFGPCILTFLGALTLVSPWSRLLLP